MEGAVSNDSPTLALFKETYLLMAFFRYCCSHRISGFTHTSLFVFSLALIRRKKRKGKKRKEKKRYQPAPCFVWGGKDLCRIGVIRCLDAALSVWQSESTFRSWLKATTRRNPELFTEQVKAGSDVCVSIGKNPIWHYKIMYFSIAQVNCGCKLNLIVRLTLLN